MRLQNRTDFARAYAFLTGAETLVHGTSLSVDWSRADRSAYPVQIHVLPIKSLLRQSSPRPKFSQKAAQS
jgi:hypothetical protein